MTQLRIFIFVLLLNFPGLVWGTGQCGETCTTSAQCTGACKYCDGFYCVACCDIDPAPSDESSCEDQFPGCHWNTSQGVCEDTINAGCSNGIPEAPGMESKGMWVLVALSVMGLVALLSKRRLQKSHPKN